jgi:hypothetical protein
MDRFFNEDPENEKPFFSNDDDDDDEDDDDEDFYELEDGTIAFLQNSDILQAMHLGMAQNELKYHLLDKAIKIAESYWLWRFKSSASKLKEISVIYQSLKTITEDHPEPPEVSEENTKA